MDPLLHGAEMFHTKRYTLQTLLVFQVALKMLLTQTTTTEEWFYTFRLEQCKISIK